MTVIPGFPSGPTAEVSRLGTGGIGSVAGELVTQPSVPVAKSSIRSEGRSVALAWPSVDRNYRNQIRAQADVRGVDDVCEGEEGLPGISDRKLGDPCLLLPVCPLADRQ